jgi:hypothetical protein
MTVNVVWKLALEGLHAFRSFLHPLQLIKTSGQSVTQFAQMVQDCSVDNISQIKLLHVPQRSQWTENT